MSRTLSGLFLVGALNRPRKRKGTNRENPPDHPQGIRGNPGKIGKVPKRTKKDKKGRTSPDRETPSFDTPPFSGPQALRKSHPGSQKFSVLAHQNRRIAIASDVRVDGAKSPEILQKEGVWGPEIAAQNRKSLATFHRTLKSQCSIAFSCLGNRCDFWGPRWASQSQIAKIAAISVR